MIPFIAVTSRAAISMAVPMSSVWTLMGIGIGTSPYFSGIFFLSISFSLIACLVSAVVKVHSLSSHTAPLWQLPSVSCQKCDGKASHKVSAVNWWAADSTDNVKLLPSFTWK